MADMTKQRLIGALLVLTVILVSAVLLIQSANQNVPETEQVTLPEFESTIHSETVEQIDAEPEVLLNPHDLPVDTPEAVVAEATAVETIEVQTAPKPAPEPVKAETKEIEKTVQADVVKEKQPTKTPVKPVAKPAPTGPQWLIQVASFGLKDNAYALQKKLTVLKIKSQVEARENSQGKMIYRVKVGPVTQQKDVDKTVDTIKQHLKLTPQVKKINAS